MFGRERTINLILGGELKLSGQLVVVPAPEPPATLPISGRVIARFDGITVTGYAPMAYTLPDDKMINVEIEWIDARGHPAQVDGDTTWTTSDAMIANVGVLAGDSTKAEIIPGANLGQAQITATADADVGQGVQNVMATLDVSVVAGSAVAGSIKVAGDPQPFPGGTPRRR